MPKEKLSKTTTWLLFRKDWCDKHKGVRGKYTCKSKPADDISALVSRAYQQAKKKNDADWKKLEARVKRHNRKVTG